MFGATSVAFAAETEEGTDGEQTRVVTFVKSAFLALDDVKTLDKLHAVGGFQLKYTWLTDVEKVNSVFEGANYVRNGFRGRRAIRPLRSCRRLG